MGLRLFGKIPGNGKKVVGDALASSAKEAFLNKVESTFQKFGDIISRLQF
jgi:hypothetical protein